MKNKSISQTQTYTSCEYVALFGMVWGETNVAFARMTSNGHQSQFSLVNDLKFRTVHLCHLLLYRRSSFYGCKRICMILDEHKQTANNTLTMFSPSDTSMLALYLLCNNGVGKKPTHRRREIEWNRNMSAFEVFKC